MVVNVLRSGPGPARGKNVMPRVRSVRRNLSLVVPGGLCCLNSFLRGRASLFARSVLYLCSCQLRLLFFCGMLGFCHPNIFWGPALLELTLPRGLQYRSKVFKNRTNGTPLLEVQKPHSISVPPRGTTTLACRTVHQLPQEVLLVRAERSSPRQDRNGS